MASRGDQTRERLLDVAQDLFGRHGVANVSLRQIRLAADQRNVAAVQYYFGDREGLVRALADRHSPRILALQEAVLERAGGLEGADFRGLVEAYVLPYAAYVAVGPGERSWIRVLSDLISNPQLSLETLSEETASLAVAVGRAVFAHVAQHMPEEVAGERVWFVAMSGIHICANRARILDDPDAVRRLSSDDAFARNLVDLSVGALSAPATG